MVKKWWSETTPKKQMVPTMVGAVHPKKEMVPTMVWATHPTNQMVTTMGGAHAHRKTDGQQIVLNPRLILSSKMQWSKNGIIRTAFNCVFHAVCK